MPLSDSKFKHTQHFLQQSHSRTNNNAITRKFAILLDISTTPLNWTENRRLNQHSPKLIKQRNLQFWEDMNQSQKNLKNEKQCNGDLKPPEDRDYRHRRWRLGSSQRSADRADWLQLRALFESSFLTPFSLLFLATVWELQCLWGYAFMVMTINCQLVNSLLEHLMYLEKPRKCTSIASLPSPSRFFFPLILGGDLSTTLGYYCKSLDE